MGRTRQIVGKDGKLVDVEPTAKAVPSASAVDDGDEGQLDVSAGGQMRRSAGGGRSFHEFFSTENRRKPMVRGEFLGFMEWFSWSTRHAAWYRRLWRWLTRTPGPRGAGPMATFADAYEERQLKPTVNAVQAKLRRISEREARKNGSVK